MSDTLNKLRGIVSRAERRVSVGYLKEAIEEAERLATERDALAAKVEAMERAYFVPLSVRIGKQSHEDWAKKSEAWLSVLQRQRTDAKVRAESAEAQVAKLREALELAEEGLRLQSYERYLPDVQAALSETKADAPRYTSASLSGHDAPAYNVTAIHLTPEQEKAAVDYLASGEAKLVPFAPRSFTVEEIEAALAVALALAQVSAFLHGIIGGHFRVALFGDTP